jgi:hypothetical protein
MGRARSAHGEWTRHKKVLMVKPGGGKLLETPRRRWENNIKIDLREVELGHGPGRCGSGQRQVSGICECGNEPLSSIKCGEFLDQHRTCWLVRKNSALFGKAGKVRSPTPNVPRCSDRHSRWMSAKTPVRLVSYLTMFRCLTHSLTHSVTPHHSLLTTHNHIAIRSYTRCSWQRIAEQTSKQH